MVLSDTILYVTLLGTTILFSAFSLSDTEHRLVFKVIAGLFWFVNSVTAFYFFGGSGLLSVPLALMFMGLGFVFCFSIVTDFRQKERDRIYGFMDD
jgi:hypothetical protein